MKNKNYTQSEGSVHHKRWVTLLTSCFLLLLVHFANGQVSGYSFAQSSGTYSPITGGSVLGNTTSDDQRWVDPAVPLGGTTTTGVGLPIGFSFTLNGQVFDRMAVNNNGWISLGNSALTPSVNNASSSSYTSLSSTSTAVPTYLRTRIAPFSRDLQGQTGSTLRYETIGSAPNRECVIQWSSYKRFGTTGTGDQLNFQIRLQENGNKVVICYGTNVFGTSLSSNTHVGLGGTLNTDFNNRTSTTNWNTTTAGGTNAVGISVGSAITVPASGLTFTYSPPTPCSTPNPGNTLASTVGACSGVNFTLSLQNATIGTGVSYQWQSSPDGSTWTNIGTNAASIAVSQTAATYYQCLVTCSTGPSTVASNPLLLIMGSTLNCYCAATHSSCSGDGVVNVVLNTLSNPSAGCPGAGNYSYFNPGIAGTQLYIGQPYTLSVTVQSDPSQFTNAWIDFNYDGILDAGEALGATINPGASGTAVFNFTVPPTAVAGITRLRIKGGVDGTFTTAQACGANIGSTFGEIEDYDIELLPEPVCIDPPTAGSAQSNILLFCNSTSVNLNLSLTGTSGGTGQTYQWQNSTDGVDFFDIVGATTASWTESNVTTSYYYQCNVTCGTSTVPSTPVYVQAVPPPAAGTISGPASVFANQAASYSSGTATGTLKWLARLVPSTTWSVVAGAVSDPQNIFFGSPGTFEVRLVASVSGCNNDSSNIVTTVVTIQNDNVCDAVPVNIGVNGPYTNVGATLEVGESAPPVGSCTGNSTWCTASSNTVWFSFTVPMGGSGRYGIGFAPGNWDSQVAIWSASACGDLLTGAAVLIGANDDSSGSSPYNAYARAHCLTPGQTYYIQVDGYATTTNSAFGLRIDDLGPADPSFATLPAQVCENGASITLVPAVAGGTFSGPGVTGNSFSPSAAGAGIHTITYTLGGLDICYSSNQSIEVVTPTYTYYADVDGDTYGNPASSILSCEASAPVGYSADNTDCNDANPSINPAAIEVCNLIDDNCNGTIDEGFDVDMDGFTSCGGDCNDNDNTVYPGAMEVCNGIDDDCNLLVDDGLTFITYYADADGDTYGDASSTVSTCNGAPMGYVGNSSDCNDANAAVNPAATEICNTIDDDCDGLVDENVIAAGSISGPASVCMAVVTGSATYSISPVFDATGYSWTAPNGMIIVSGQGTTSIFVSWSPQAVHDGIVGNVTVTPSNACGNGIASSLGVDIGAIIPVKPGSISGPTKLCPGDNGTYSVAPVARASNYVWTLPAGMSIIGGAGTNVITVDVSGGYLGGVVSCRAANACGMGPNRDRNVNVNVPAVSASISGPASGVCGATGVSYTAAAVVAATGYNWSVPAGATIMSGQGTQTIVVDFDGSYGGGNISVNATNACGVGAARNMNVTGAPGLPGVISGDITICPGQSGVAYGVATVTGASSYLWSLPGGTTITSGQGTKDILATWGTNPASGLNLSVNASNGCGTSANRVLNGISISVSHCGPRFGDQGELTGLNVYPNPAADRAVIVFNSVDGADFNLKMVDISGRTIMTERGTAANGLNQREVNVSEMASGIYFVVIETNSVVEQIKVIVE